MISFDDALYVESGYDLERIQYVNHTSIPFIFHTSCCKDNDQKMKNYLLGLKQSIQILTNDIERVYFNSHSLNDIDVFMDKYFASCSTEFKEKLKKIEKIDIFRILIVYIFGGFWSDTDITL